ncbi:UPL1-like protein, partial [Mya arenaria]
TWRKKLTFVKNSNKIDFERTLEEAYPKLKDCGGYELLRTPPGSRIALESLIVPTGGFSAAYLADESNLGQALCYIRPIQKDLDMGILNTEPSEPCQECLTCGDMIPTNLLRDHVSGGCRFTETTDPPEKIQRISVQTPVCQFACTSTSSRQVDSQIPVDQSKKASTSTEEDCPVCGERFSLEILSVHAAPCGDTSCNDVIIPRTLLEAVKEMRANIDDKTETPWTIKVVRRLFSTTAIEQLEETELEDWNKTLRVHFIGEEGVDAGGLQREFFSLLFKGSPVFEGNTFSFKPNLLDKKEYCLIGKAVATAILNGHPGPRCLNQHITKYILEGVEPDFRVIPTDEIQRLDVGAAIKQIEDATTETVADEFNETISLLEETGYSELLTAEKKQYAVSALKGHFLLYRLHGILELLQQHTKEANSYLSEDCNPTAHDVGSFFIPEFSTDADQKATEEMIIYNWNKFLKKIEKSKIITPWLDVNDGNQPDVTLNMGHVLQSLLGCTRLPVNLSFGTIQFDHISRHLPKVNTCAPSILFTKTKELENYETFEEILLYIIVGSYGFGTA